MEDNRNDVAAEATNRQVLTAELCEEFFTEDEARSVVEDALGPLLLLQRRFPTLSVFDLVAAVLNAASLEEMDAGGRGQLRQWQGPRRASVLRTALSRTALHGPSRTAAARRQAGSRPRASRSRRARSGSRGSPGREPGEPSGSELARPGGVFRLVLGAGR